TAPVPGTDLTSVRLDGDGAHLTLTFTATADFPRGPITDDQTVAWKLDVLTGQRLLYEITVALDASGTWTATIFDVTGGDPVADAAQLAPVIAGATLSHTIPASDLVHITG